MDPVTGALVAAAVGWASIVAVVVAPLERIIAPERLRAVGAVTLALVGLSALGAPLPDVTPIGLMTVGLFGAALERPLRDGVTLPRVDELSLPGCRVPDPDRPQVAEAASAEPRTVILDDVGLTLSTDPTTPRPRGPCGKGTLPKVTMTP